MDRSWMYGLRNTSQFFNGVHEFVKVAVAHQKQQGQKGILCPCSMCRNIKRENDVNIVLQHLFEKGFRENYMTWTFHGENRVDVEHLFPGATSSHLKRKATHITTTSNDIDDGVADDDANEDRIDELLNDVYDNFDYQPKSYENLIEAANISLFTGSEFSKLSVVLKLFHLKAKHGWSNVSFTELLILLQEMLPEGNTLLDTSYKARKLLCPMGTEWEKIHACPADCILYRNEYENLNECPKCHTSRYKKKKGINVGFDAEYTKTPAKVLWYLPIIPRFKRLFMNEKDAKNLVWHAQDAPQWRQIDLKYPDFGKEDRNLRLGLCTDGMNPYGTLSSQHSTWPVLLVIYNLPSWLCMKRKYIMLSLLISGPQQPGNDIDVYLAPLVDDLKLMWNEGVTAYDMHTKTNFNLCALLYCTINDFPAYGNLSGYTVKGGNACPICEDDTLDLRLPNCKKNVYMSHRRFLPRNHRYRALKKAFNGKAEHGVPRRVLSGSEIYDKVKDLNTVFGKPYKRNKHSLWKKKSIFWELPYWKDLSVRHCLDLMHIGKNVCDSIISTIMNVPGKTKVGINI
ncbi:unnamed protein product [Cuscuta europaea]|uniref:Transposase-associated domain-containing protein n=1 Tax=Cuscuta europaea TaxID=41803 RepID=A0A9P1DZI5_CUSEU|nr:unnamed protein product [Cuscuta europaea]